MNNIEVKDIFDTQFENNDWYDERVRFYKFVIFASVGILTTLAFSWEKIPQKVLNQDDFSWMWLYRDSLILSGLTALLGLLTYYFTFRNRFFVPYAKNITANYKAKKIREKAFPRCKTIKLRKFFLKNTIKKIIIYAYCFNATVRILGSAF